jgi:hypothetical protein
MAITKDQAMSLDRFHDDGTCPVNAGMSGREKGPAIWRRTGRTKTWVTRPDDFRVPVAYGLYQHSHVTPTNNNVHAEADCPRNEVA